MASIFLDLICSVYVVTNKTGVNYSSEFPLKVAIFLDLVCSVYVETKTTGETIVLGFPLKVALIFLDLICSVYVIINTTGVNYSFRISFKCGFYIQGPFMFSICNNQYKWGKL